MTATNWRKSIFNFILYGLLVYLALLLFLYVAQRSFIYFPMQDLGAPGDYGMPYMQVIQVKTEDGLSLTGWYKEPDDPEKPVIVMFHGNAGHIGIRNFKADGFIKRGYGFLFAEYRGYGGNPGQPSEDGFYYDGRAYMDFLIEDISIDKQDIVLYGESLGTGVTVQMALEYPGLGGLILEAPFTSLVDLGKKQYFFMPVGLLMKDRFESEEKIGDIYVPLLIIHGKNDMIVPYRFGAALFEAANEPKTMEEFTFGMHNDLYVHGAGDKVLEFLDGLETKSE